MPAPPSLARDLSLYIHFPFCERKCPYCDFNSHERANIPEEDYVAAILWRLQSLSRDKTTQNESILGESIFGASRLVRSIFFGGGTPSLLSAHAVERILDGASKNFRLAPDCEITLEANPSSAEKSKFADWKAAGINRVSLGVQSFDDKALRFLGRLHDARQARSALEAASRLFARFSFDLIAALPRQSDKALKRELACALSFNASHLCVYQLTIEKATAFYRAQACGALALPSPARAAHLYRLVSQELAARGYENYEISCYARGQEAQSRHNLVYWRSGEWLGVGPGAHGRISHFQKRIATLETRDPNRWLRQAHAQDGRIEKRIVLSDQEVLQERVMMGLRLEEGLPMILFDAAAHARIVDLCKAGYCEKTSLRLNLTTEGRLRLDTIVACLLAEPSSVCQQSLSADGLGTKERGNKHFGERLGKHVAAPIHRSA